MGAGAAPARHGRLGNRSTLILQAVSPEPATIRYFPRFAAPVAKRGFVFLSITHAPSPPMPRLLVLACSARKHRTPHPVPAWYRYDGVFFRLCKHLQADRQFPPDVRIRILSAEHGVLTPETPIAWYDRRLDDARAAELRESVTRALCHAVDAEHASEVYLALGRRYRAVIGGLPPQVSVRGAPAGIGTMQSQLRSWLAVPPTAGGQLHLELSPARFSLAQDGPATRPPVA